MGTRDTTGRRSTGDRPDTLLVGPLAHRVEQGTFNPKVARSRLARPTSSEGRYFWSDAQFDFIRSVNKVKPILLLDDIFDKLDSARVGQIVKLVSDSNFGQIFITDTNREHLDGIIREVGGADFKIFLVSDGQISLM